jgi:RNA polymerase sigma-70 factor (ECF subfamily)
MAAERAIPAVSGVPSSNGRSACAGEAIGLHLVPSSSPQPPGCVAWDDQRRRLQEAIDQYQGPLVRYATRIIGDAERSRDVVQETFLRMCRESAVTTSGHLGPWLFTVCRRLAIDVRRKETRMNTSGNFNGVCEAMGPRQTTPAAVRDEEFEQVVRLLADLPSNQQEVVRLKFQEEMSYKQIASVTGLSVSNVGYLLHTAVMTLRERMKN